MNAGYSQQVVTIDDGESISNFIDIVGFRIIGVHVPVGAEGDAVRFLVDPTGTVDDADVPIAKNEAGEEIRAVYGTLPSLINLVTNDTTNRGRIVPGSRVAVQSLTTGNAQAQTGDVSITLVLEHLQAGW